MAGLQKENTIRITLNDEEMSVLQGHTLEALVKKLALDDSQRIAIAVNDSVVQRSDWSSHQLQDNDRVLMIAPIQGG